MCIHTFSICTRSVIYILLAIILAFGTILIADRLSPAALTLIHAGIFILCCMIPELVVFLPLFCFYLSKRPVCFTAPIGVLSIILASAKLPMDALLLIGVRCPLSVQHIIRISDYSAYHPSSTDEAPYRYIGDKRTSGKGTNPYDPEGTG